MKRYYFIKYLFTSIWRGGRFLRSIFILTVNCLKLYRIINFIRERIINYNIILL